MSSHEIKKNIHPQVHVLRIFFVVAAACVAAATVVFVFAAAVAAATIVYVSGEGHIILREL